MQVAPYLFFDGNCEAAMTHYAKVLNAQIKMMVKGSDVPEGKAPPDFANKIMHAALEYDGGLLMASDVPNGQFNKPQGYAVSVNVEQPAEAERVFHALAEGGDLTMPMSETFWAKRFGMCVDRFGTHWMVGCS